VPFQVGGTLHRKKERYDFSLFFCRLFACAAAPASGFIISPIFSFNCGDIFRHLGGPEEAELSAVVLGDKKGSFMPPRTTCPNYSFSAFYIFIGGEGGLGGRRG
jgi:hypothetical protein